jgi:uncharacterized damage-inducible protein DinB
VSTLEVVQIFIEYHIDMSRRVWDSVNQISEQQFLADDPYLRGSVRNLMVHFAHTDLRWLTGLKNLPNPAGSMRRYEEYADRAAARAYWEQVAADLSKYVAAEELGRQRQKNLQDHIEEWLARHPSGPMEQNNSGCARGRCGSILQ